MTEKPDFHALVIGQSNAANHGPTPQRVDSDKASLFFKGALQPLHDPLPGGSGTGGSVWTRLGRRLLATDRFDRIIFTLAAIDGASIRELAPGGKYFPAIANPLSSMSKTDLVPSHVFIHQGEQETLLATSASDYLNVLKSLIACLRNGGVGAPVFVCRNTYRNGLTNKDVRSAQEEIVDPANHIFAGPDTDSLGEDWRSDDNVHFSDAGLEAFADLWMGALRLDRNAPAESAAQ